MGVRQGCKRPSAVLMPCSYSKIHFTCEIAYFIANVIEGFNIFYLSGELFFGKTGFSPLTAQQVYAATLIKRAKAVGLQDAKAATATLANA